MVNRDLIVVIPGITGSSLRTADHTIFGFTAGAILGGLTRTSAVLEKLRLPDGLGDAEPGGAAHLEPAAIIPGVHLLAGFWAGAGYGALIYRLRNVSASEPERVIPFPYDWRLSNRLSAHRLKEVVEPRLANWRERPGRGEDKVIFVCHSMGGLIARYYLEVLGGREIARRLITIGTPYSGSVKAIRALSGDLLPRLPRLSEQLTVVARTMPAVGQLLPTYNCVQAGGEATTAMSVNLPDVPGAAVRDAFRLSDEIAGALARNGPPPYEHYAFGGRKQPTDQSVSTTGERITYHRDQRGVDHAGDGTVPLFSSVPPGERSTASGIFHAVKHSWLQRHHSIIDLISDKVGDVELGAVLFPGFELSLDLPEVVAAGGEIPIAVTAEVPDLLLHASFESISGGPTMDPVPLDPGEDCSYAGTARLPAGVWIVTVADVAANAAPIAEVILVFDPLTN
jgi:pimeloyl-ACP methyl ester carboxylesterase